MTNIEWVRTLSADELVDFISPSCNMCIHGGNCTKDCSCIEGKVKWLNENHAQTYRVNWCIHRGGHFDIKATSEEEAMQIVQKEKFSEILTDIKNDISLSIDTGE